MRPRISRLEAQFLLETMQKRKEEIAGLVERRKALESEMVQLRKDLFWNPYVAIDPAVHFKDKKAELQQLEAQSYRMFELILCFDSLIAKLTPLAEGTKLKGRYKTRATLYQWQLPKLVEPKNA